MEYDRPGIRFTAWCDGLTGYPIVDAGMRQLRSEGWMHNRVRMIVASCLVTGRPRFGPGSTPGST